MIKGLLTGGVSGLVLGGFAVVGLSVVAEQPAGNVPPVVPQLNAPVAAQDTATSETSIADVSAEQSDDSIAGTTSGVIGAPAVAVPPVASDVPVADTTPLDPPAVIAAAEAPTSPQAISEPLVIASAEEPVLPNPQSIAPQVPANESDIVVVTTPAEPPAPVIVDTPEPVAEVVVVEPVKEPESPVQAADIAPEVAPVAPAVVTPEIASDTQVAAPSPDAAPMIAAPNAPEIGTVDTAEAQLPDVDTQTAEPAGDETQAPEVTAQPTVVTLIGEGETALPGGAGNVRVNRLGQSEELPAPAEPEATEIIDLPADAPALQRFAATLEDPSDKPTVSVVLIDDGRFEGAVPAVAGIPFAVTVMLDPGADGAKEKMAAYRAAGIEVGVLAQLPQGATATDMLVYFEGAFASLPETIAVLDATGAALQSDAETVQAAMEVIAEDGRGLLTVSQGLNTTLREAEKSGVPAAVVFRDLDADGQDARVIRRFMDQAAFRARQDTGVIMLGRVRADTISALILWGTANRAGQVAMVPLSHVLLSQ